MWRPSKLTSMFLPANSYNVFDVILPRVSLLILNLNTCLSGPSGNVQMTVWPNPPLLTISLGEIQGKISKLPIALYLGARVMAFNGNFNNISVVPWWSVLLVEETGVPGENHRPAASH